MAKKILATITTYNPDIKLLVKNIDSIINQVDHVIIYENASKNRAEVIELCNEKNIEIILNDENQGVAGPLHDGVDYADINGYDYILTLDQDSISGDGMVDDLVSLLESDANIAMVGPTLINPDIGISREDEKDSYVNMVITSGALARIGVLKSIGNYIREMFIDAVDNEICYRLRKNGYQIARSKTIITHCMGEPEVHKFLFKIYRTRNYSPLRYYYTWRNSYFIFKVYKKDKKAMHELKDYLRRTKIKIILAEKNKREKLAAIRKGKKDAKKFYQEMKEKYAFL